MSNERCPECSGHRGLPRMIHDGDSPRECTNDYHKQADVLEFKLPEAPDPVAPADPTAPTEGQTPAPEAAPETPQGRPVCPYCGCEGNLRAGQTTFGPFKVMCIRCGNNDCRKILGFFQPLELQMQSPPPPGMFPQN